MKLERSIEFYPAWDRRDPDPSKNYGIHGVEIQFVVKGELGGVTFGISTSWFLKHNREEIEAKGTEPSYFPSYSMLTVHSPVPIMGGYAREGFNCSITGGECYCVGLHFIGREDIRIVDRGRT